MEMTKLDGSGHASMSPSNKRVLHTQFSVESMRSRSGSEAKRRRTSWSRKSSLSLHHWDSFKVVKKAQHDSEIEIDIGKVPWWTSYRVRLSVLCFVGFFCLYANRVNLSVAIICMVKQDLTNHNESAVLGLTNGTFVHNQSEEIDQSSSRSVVYGRNASESRAEEIRRTAVVCPASLWTSNNKQGGDFDWDKPLRGLLLGAFFWGYTVMQIPAGWLAERYGPRETITAGMLTVSVLTILTPVLAKGSPYLLLVGRIIIGVGEAMMYPGAQVLWAKWAPPDERSRLVGFSFGGCQLGNALAFPVASLLCQYGFDGGWPAIFYVLGGVALLWTLVWVVTVRNTPLEMPGISDAEARYIESSLGHVIPDTTQNRKKHLIPWKEILMSLPVWAILVANFCSNYGAYMLLTQMPAYMKEVLNFDIKSNGIFSMIPYLVFWIFVIIAGLFADFFIARNILSIEKTRKLCCAIGMFIPGMFLIIVGYMDCFRQIEAVALLTLSLAFCGFQFASFFVNHADIAPDFAGTIFGVTNTGASIPGILAPYVVSKITQNKTPEEWRVAFFIAAAIYAVGGIFYIVFAKGRLQSWASEEEEGDDDIFEENNINNKKRPELIEEEVELNGKSDI